MSEETDRRDERTAQLVDEPTEQVEQRVSDRDDDASPDSVAVDTGDTAPGTDAATEAGVGDVEDTNATSDDAAAEADERDQLMPGEMGAVSVGALWSSEIAGGLRTRWQELQLRFVDDPRGVVTEAQSLVGEMVQGLTKTLTEQQRELDGWASGGNGDTEQLRVALQRYRDFFDRVLGQV